ncbi:MAG TPA: FecR domain-containing protein [Oxalicibacterium sp.]|nr:FecR domain-containing protein [Oxalicibacterium sp.]
MFKDEAIPDVILDEAALWLMELHGSQFDPQQRQKLKEWRARSTAHERAWQRASMFAEKIQSLPPEGARALKKLAGADRRKAVKTLAALLVAAPAGWLACRYALQSDGVRYNTAVGQQRDVILDDGTRLVLNTDTEVDAVFNEYERRLVLHRGEILVTTAKDRTSHPRPFSVQVHQGNIRALGTRFIARQEEEKSHVAVMEGAVEISPADNASAKVVVPANEQSSFTSRQADLPVALEAGADSWADGMLIAHKMPMAAFIAQLNRYRPGKLRYDTRIAGLSVSGAFSLRDTDQTLATLEQTMPVRVQYLTRYWATVVPR